METDRYSTRENNNSAGKTLTFHRSERFWALAQIWTDVWIDSREIHKRDGSRKIFQKCENCCLPFIFVFYISLWEY